MNETIKVHVCRQKGRTNLVMRYVCPESGKQIWKTAGTSNERKALQAAAVWQAELREGRYQKASKVTWQEFRQAFQRDKLDGMKVGTALVYEATLNVFTKRCKPGRLAELTTAKVTAFATMLRDDGLAAATIARHLRTLKVAARWAHKQGMLVKLPEFTMPKQAKGMKGRPICGEEFDRWLAAAGDDWAFYSRGLWWSGLRLGESLDLRWDEAPGALVADFTGRRPMLRIPAESEKGNTHRLLPMAPEFAQLLQTVPEAERSGYVFTLPPGVPRTRHAVCRRFAAIGEAAGIIAKQKPGKDDEGKPCVVNQYATAHDLRRSFGFRWSRRVMPTVLRELMRHESLETTMRYYVGQNAEATADELWRAVEAGQGSETSEVANQVADT